MNGGERRKRFAPGILTRTALLSWLVVIMALAVFVAVIVPSQKRVFIESLDSKADGVSSSLLGATAGAAVSEDFSTVVEQCMALLTEEPTIRYLVLTRKDGFSLVHKRDGWRQDQLSGIWLPRRGKHDHVYSLMSTPETDGEVFHHSRLVEYSGIEWGWIHVGLALEGYHASVDRLYQRIGYGAMVSAVLGLVASIVYARQISRPLLDLKRAAVRVARGDFSARAEEGEAAEFGELARSFNRMTESVHLRDSRLRDQARVLSELAADAALVSGDQTAVAGKVSRLAASTLGVGRCGVWLLEGAGRRLTALDLFDFGVGRHRAGETIELDGVPAYARALETERTIAASDAALDPRTRELGGDGRVVSRLDAPVRRGGVLVGVVGVEHLGDRREWTLDEQSFAASLADLMALAIEARERRHAQDALRRHLILLNSVRDVAQRFLSAEDWRGVIGEVLGSLGVAVEASRVYVFENGRDREGVSVASCTHEWVAEGVEPQLSNPDLQGVPWEAAGLGRMAAILARREAYSGHVEELPPAERMVLESQGIVSLILVPVFVSGGWWGFIGFDECGCRREWTEAERGSLQAAADTLGSAVERQVGREALLVAKEAAEQGSRAKSQFLANMSHEIRTPLNGVIGMLELLKQTELTSKQRRYAVNASSSAEGLLSVIGDVLDFSKIEAGKLELLEVVFSLQDLVDESVKMFAERAEAKGLELVVDIEPNMPRKLVGDPDRLKRIVVNLVGNAIKFTEQGQVVMRCRRTGVVDGVADLLFEVVDTGCGIPEGQQQLVFEAFAQADNSMSRTHGGTGLGLAISKQLAELMGGGIGVRSVQGRGSTFWFTVRMKLEAGDGQDLESLRSALSDLRGLRVLVLDDSAVAREIITSYVATWHGTTESVGDARSALVMLTEAAGAGRPFDVAVVDWRMPGIDGRAFAQLVRAEESLSRLGLVLMSGFSNLAELNDASDYGFSATVPKPVRPSELYDAIVVAANAYSDEERPTAVREVVVPKLDPAGGGGARVLLVEDNEINREVAVEILSAMGYRCACATDGMRAVEAVQRGGVDVVLMDCQMPVLDGYEATRRIRGWEASAGAGRVPIIALTAHAMKGDADRCLEAGMDDYLTKPLDPRLLAGKLKRWTGGGMEGGVGGLDAVGRGGGVGGGGGGGGGELDMAELMDRCMESRELAVRLLEGFLVQLDVDLGELKRRRLEGDLSGVGPVAHRLKGAAATVAAERVRSCAARMELAAKGGEKAVAFGLMGELEEAVELTKRAIARVVAV